jgi:hypothetical protein
MIGTIVKLCMNVKMRHLKSQYVVVMLLVLLVCVGLSTFLRTHISVRFDRNGRQTSKVKFSTGSAATCLRSRPSSDNVDRKLCHRLFNASGSESGKSSSSPFSDRALKVDWYPATDYDYVTCASDCDRFRSEFGYSLSITDVTEEEREFPLAFRSEIAFNSTSLHHSCCWRHIGRL